MASLGIRNATVFTGTGNVLPNASVIVRDGRIVAVGRDLDLPPDAETLDASGQFLMAGFIDSHTHLTLYAPLERPEPQLETAYWAVNAARQKLASGVTTVRDIGGNNYHDLVLRRAIQTGQVAGPRMMCAGRLIAPTGGHVYYWAREADGPDEIRKAVREQIRARADFIKLMLSGGAANIGERPDRMQMQADEIEAAVREADEAGKKVAVHAHPSKAIRIAAELGVHTVEHASGLDDPTIEAVIKNDVWIVPTQAVYKRIADNVDGFPIEKAEIVQRVWDKKVPTLIRAIEAGVKIGVGTDCGRHYPYADFVGEMVELREVGMSNEQVLLAATRGNAEMMELGHEIGTVEDGKLADLVLLGANPLEDLNHARDVRKIIQGGVVLDPKDLTITGKV